MSKKRQGRSSRKLPRNGRDENAHVFRNTREVFVQGSYRVGMEVLRFLDTPVMSKPSGFAGGGSVEDNDPLAEQNFNRLVFLSFSRGGNAPPTKQEVVRELPTVFAIVTLLLSKGTRDEILADLQEWYGELVETRGIGWARVFVIGKLLSAVTGQLLTVADQVAGIVGKVWGRQKG